MKHIQMDSEVCASLGQRGPPLTGPSFGCKGRQALLLRVICLCDGGVELVASGSVSAFEFKINLCRRFQMLFQRIRAAERGGAVRPVNFLNRFGNIKIGCGAVHFLLRQFLTENGIKLCCADRLEGGGIQQRVGLGFHIRPKIVPLLRHLLLG